MMCLFDSTTVTKISNQPEMDKFVASLDLSSPNVVIKPNWVDALKGTHSEAKILDMFFSSLANKNIFLVESYTFWRTDKMTAGQGDYFSSDEATFVTAKQHWDFFKKQDEWFLSFTGIDKIIDKYHAKYINITNELWAGRSSPVPLVPQVLYNLQGSDFISFAKLKGDSEYGASLAIKNLFGLYPDPKRTQSYHGEHDERLSASILQINQTYQKLFKCLFVVEGVFTASYVDWEKNNFKPFENFGLIIGGKDAVEVDSTVLKLINRRFTGPISNLLSDYQLKIGGHLQSQNIPPAYQVNFSQP